MLLQLCETACALVRETDLAYDPRNLPREHVAAADFEGWVVQHGSQQQDQLRRPQGKVGHKEVLHALLYLLARLEPADMHTQRTCNPFSNRLELRYHSHGHAPIARRHDTR